jgi:tetratricopeptide (TPR) repeat protein
MKIIQELHQAFRFWHSTSACEWGSTHLNRREYQQAIAAFSRAIALQPLERAAYLHRGRAWLALANYPAALADFEAVLPQPGLRALAHADLGTTYHLLDDRYEAIAHFNLSLYYSAYDRPVQPHLQETVWALLQQCQASY